jgi:hypothetical protein
MYALVAVSEPHHVHFYRHAIEELRRRGHRVTVAATADEEVLDLLAAHGIDHTVLSPSVDSPDGEPSTRGMSAVRLFATARRARPDVVTAVADSALAYVASLTGIRCVLFPDGDVSAGLEFADEVHTPVTTVADYGPRQRRYAGFPELAAVHPDRFQPDRDRLREATLDTEEPYVLLEPGTDEDPRAPLSPTTRRLLRVYLDNHATVYRVTDRRTIVDVETGATYTVDGPHYHDLLGFASLYVGTDRRRATETALLGTPSLWARPDSTEPRPGTVAALVARGLLCVPDDDAALLERVFDLVPNPTSSGVWRQRRDSLLEDTVDVTTHVVGTLCGKVRAGGPPSRGDERHNPASAPK